MPPVFGSPVKKAAISMHERSMRRWDLRLQSLTPRHNRAAPCSSMLAVARARSWMVDDIIVRACSTTYARFCSPGTQLVGANMGRRCIMCPDRFRGQGTQLVGAIGPPLHPCHPAASAAPPGTQLVGDIGPPLHKVPRLLPQPGYAVGRHQRASTAPGAPTAFAVQPHNSSAPTSRLCTMCPGRFRGPPGTALSWSTPTGRRCTMSPGSFRSPGTQLVGAIGPPLQHMCPGCFRGPGKQLVGAIGPPLHIVPWLLSQLPGH
eukprot:jgi/Tetstr1/462258/TSEL_000656.t1